MMAPDGTLHGDRYLAPGTRVCLEHRQNDEISPEYGVVVHCWHDDQLQGYDCYVAFFGDGFPPTMPPEKPYILRYSASTLATIEDVSYPP